MNAWICAFLCRCWSVGSARTSSPCRGTRSLVFCCVVTPCATTASPGCPSMAGRFAAPSTDRSPSWVSGSQGPPGTVFVLFVPLWDTWTFLLTCICSLLSPASSHLFRGFWSLGFKEELCSFGAPRAPPEWSYQPVRSGRRHPERHGRGKAPRRPTQAPALSPHLAFSLRSASSAVTRTRATRPPCTAPCAPPTCVPNAPSSPTPPAHWPNTAGCRWRTSLTRRPCARSTRSTPSSLCAWRRPVSPGPSCAACARSTANIRDIR